MQNSLYLESENFRLHREKGHPALAAMLGLKHLLCKLDAFWWPWAILAKLAILFQKRRVDHLLINSLILSQNSVTTAASGASQNKALEGPKFYMNKIRYLFGSLSGI